MGSDKTRMRVEFQSTHPLRGATCIFERLLHPMYFNPRTPCGVRLDAAEFRRVDTQFQSTHPLRGATRALALNRALRRYFNPRTPCGVRLLEKALDLVVIQFQSTHPLRGATSALVAYRCLRCISIHAPLAGCDRSVRWDGDFQQNFNPRTPCGVRLLRLVALPRPKRFQSTHPLRGATSGSQCTFLSRPYFNPRTPCGVRRTAPSQISASYLISIHAPLAGCDPLE